MNRYIKNISIFLFLLLSFSASGQTTDDIKKEADGLFRKEKFVEATVLYLQLLNVEPRNHELNFKYGACLIYSAQDKSESIRFLNFSVKSNTIDPQAHYYLGKAYHLNFQFTKAILAYSKFKEVGSQSDLKKFNIEANINACENGKQLLTNITDMIVMNKTEVKQQDFYELYKLNNIGGSLLVTDQFQTKIDKKLGHRPIIYFPQNSPYIFYSSYGESGNTGLDIYVKQKLPNGKWSNAIKVVGDVNTNLDEDYPFLSLDGKYLYYSSKGHNSMGGYDVFRSKVIVEGSSFSKPENMDFAISSPNDDILYIVDSLDRTAYFSSARESQDGKLFVYEVRVEKIPMQLAVLKGEFSNEIDPGNKKIKVEVIDYTTGAIVGTYNSSPGSGSLLMTIPKSGKYIFEMSVNGSGILHRADVSIPYVKEFRPLKLDLVHQLNNGQEIIVVNTRFDDKFDDPTAIMAGVYQRISKLNPNANKYDLDSLNSTRNDDDVFLQAGLDKYSTAKDIQVLLSKAAENSASSKENLEEFSFMAHNIAERKQAEAKTKILEATKLADEAIAASDANTKKSQLTAAFKITEDAKNLNEEASVLIGLGDKLEEEIKKRDKELVSINSALLASKGIEGSDADGLKNFIQKNTAVLSVASASKVNTDLLENIEKEGNEKRKELNQIVEKIDNLSDRKTAIESTIQNAQNTINTTKKKKEIEELESQIQSSQSELDLIINEIKKYSKKQEAFYNDEMNEIALVEAVTEIKSETNQTKENQQSLSNTQKLKIKYSINDQEFLNQIEIAEKIFKENDIKGESFDLTNLNKSTVVPAEYKTSAQAEARINDILAELATETDPVKKQKLQNELQRVNAIKEEKIEQEALITIVSVTKADLITDFSQQQSNIIAIKNIEQQKAAQANLNEDLIAVAGERISEIEKQDILSDAEQSELKQLTSIITEAESDLVDYEEWKVAVRNQSNSADFTYEDALRNANSDYQTNLEAIENGNLSDEEKTEELKSLNRNTLSNAKEKLQESEAKLNANPENELAFKEKRQYSRLVSELENNGVIPLVEPVKSADLPISNLKLTKDQLLPNYTVSVSKIESSSINEIDIEKAKKNINSELLVKLNRELQLLRSNPEKAKSKEGKSAVAQLEKLKKEVEDEIATSIAIIDKKLQENPDLSNSVESIATNYTSKSYQINELNSDFEKIEAIKKLNAQAVADIEKEIKKTKIANATNPREELQYEIQELEVIKKELEVNHSKDYYGVVVLDSDEKLEDIKGGTSVNEIDPEFYVQLESIFEDAISQKDLERQKIELYQNTLAKTNRELRRVQNGVNTTPENKKQLQKRAQSLNEIKFILEEKIYESKAIAGEDIIAFSVNVDVQDANPDYLSSVNEIKKIEDQDEKEKAVVQLNKETVELIERKISMIDEDIRKNGRDSKKISLIQKYGQLIAEIEANPQLPAKGSVQNITASNDVTQSKLDEKTEFPVIFKDVNINEALPNYKSEIDSIINGVMSQQDKETKKIDLFERSISKLKSQVKELETYSRIESPNKQYAEEKLQNTNDIIEVLQAEKKQSEANLEKLQVPQMFVGISDIMPDYETRKEKIEYENSGVVDKLQKTNELNKVLIFEIENKVQELEKLQEDEFSLTRSENIENLRELLILVSDDLAVSSNILKISEEDVDLVAINENKFEPLNPDNFKNDLETNQLNLIKKDVKLIKTFEKDIARLNRKKARLSGNDATKIQKEIDKTVAKQTTIHNRLISDLEAVIDEKLWIELSSSKENAIKIKGANMHSEDIRNAEEGILIAEAKIEKAKSLRAEASLVKNQLVANSILLKAAKLEYDAQQVLEASNAALTTAAIIAELTSSESVVVNVEESVDNRISSDLFKTATDIERRAYAAEARASQLNDSLTYVKKKYRDAIVIEIEQLKAEQDRLMTKADDIRYKAGEIEIQEKELYSVKPLTPKKDIPKTDQVIALKSPVYRQYFDEFSEAESKISEANEIQNEIDILKEKASKIVRAAIVLDASTTMEDHQSNPEVIEVLQQIDKLTLTQKMLKEEAIANYRNANTILKTSSESENTKESIASMVQRNILPTAKVNLNAADLANTATASVIEQANIEQNNQDNTVAAQDATDNINNVANQNSTTNQTLLPQASSDYIPPNRLKGQLFRITEKSVYSDANPIPVNETQPEGLVYKVQVGAFRNPLPPETFSKFAPISGQALNSGVTRYMVGYFTNFSPANDAKSEIRNLEGYSDAFVVAYYNGEKITISRAKELEQDGTIPGPIAVVQNNDTDNAPVTTPIAVENPVLNSREVGYTAEEGEAESNSTVVFSENVVVKPVTAIDRSKTEYYTSVPNAAEASQVEIINGLFYTVQIGVYSKPVPSSELFNVSPLNSQLTKSSKIRYSTGIYTLIEDAVKRKNELVNIGLVDAFVTAYFNGSRISIVESKELIAEKGNAILTTGQTISEVEGVPASRFNKENVYFRILIGKYESTVPSNVANYLFNDDNIFFETEIDIDNTIYLFTQKFYNLADVKKGLVEINELGFEDMEILSFYNIQTIPFNEAQKIINNEPIEKITELETPTGINVDEIFYEADAIYYKVIIQLNEDDDVLITEDRAEELSSTAFEQEVTTEGEVLLNSINLATFENAKSVADKIASDGLITAKVQAFHKYTKISVDKALEIKGR